MRQDKSELVELAELLARAFLRLAKTSRPSAVSGEHAEQKRLDVLAVSRPDVTDNEAA